jgi:hypothetical protein
MSYKKSLFMTLLMMQMMSHLYGGNKSQRYKEYEILAAKVDKVLPEDKKKYWLGRIIKCKSLSAKTQLCNDIIKHFGGET